MARILAQASRWLLCSSLPCLLLPCLLVLAGCSDAPQGAEDPPVVKNLYDISQAYGLIIGTTQKPPTSMQQISTTLAELHSAGLGRPPEEVLKSPRDGLPIVVVLGVQLNPEEKGTIFAYEQKGADGKRYVMTLSSDVYLKSDQEFAEASFARGHKPAKS
jgi:hypothetical protein